MAHDWRTAYALAAEHSKLKQQIEELRREHERILRHGATRAERHAHQHRLHENRIELEEHFGRLRQHAEQQLFERQRGGTLTNAIAIDND
jgi:hypothetical protein